MNVLDGLLFGLGLQLSVILPLLVAVTIKLAAGKKAKVSLWRAYLKKSIKDHNYEEASFVTGLIMSKEDTDEVKLPKGYSLKKKTKVKDNGSESIFDLELEEIKWIEKDK